MRWIPLTSLLARAASAVVVVAVFPRIAVDFALDHPSMASGLVLAGAELSSDKPKSVDSVLALSALAKEEGLERAIDVIIGMPSFVSGNNATAPRRIRQIYLDNHDVFEAGFPLVTFAVAHDATGRLTQIKAPTFYRRVKGRCRDGRECRPIGICGLRCPANGDWPLMRRGG